ncbi:hypothetical protein BD626DRAFT_516834, partial [Schizophyllum amplum]
EKYHSPPTEPVSNGLAGTATASSTTATPNHATIPSTIGAPALAHIPIGPLTPFRALKVLHFEPSVKLKFKKGEVSATAVLEMCTSLTTLCVRERKPVRLSDAVLWSTQIQAMRPWGAILSSLDQVKLPQFSELYMGCRWPTDERAIAGSFWVPYAEELLEKGIEMRIARICPGLQ